MGTMRVGDPRTGLLWLLIITGPMMMSLGWVAGGLLGLLGGALAGAGLVFAVGRLKPRKDPTPARRLANAAWEAARAAIRTRSPFLTAAAIGALVCSWVYVYSVFALHQIDHSAVTGLLEISARVVHVSDGIGPALSAPLPPDNPLAQAHAVYRNAMTIVWALALLAAVLLSIAVVRAAGAVRAALFALSRRQIGALHVLAWILVVFGSLDLWIIIPVRDRPIAAHRADLYQLVISTFDMRMLSAPAWFVLAVYAVVMATLSLCLLWPGRRARAAAR
jgi:hypothetical protein